MRYGLARLACVLLALPVCGTSHARAITSPAPEPRESQTRRTVLERTLTEIRDREPGGVHEAETLRALGDMAVERHDLAAAERYSWDALALFEKLRPGAMDVAAMRTTLGVKVDRIRVAHLLGGRDRAVIIAGDELRKHRDTLAFSFTRGDSGKPRMHWPAERMPSCSARRWH